MAMTLNDGPTGGTGTHEWVRQAVMASQRAANHGRHRSSCRLQPKPTSSPASARDPGMGPGGPRSTSNW